MRRGAFRSVARLIPASDRRVARQTLWMSAITAAQLLGGVAQVALSARILGPEGFGVLGLIMAVALIAHGLLSMPGGEAVTTFVTRSVAEGRPDEASRVLRFTLAVSFGMSLVAYAVIAVAIFAASGLVGIDPAYRGAALMYGSVGVFLATQTETMAVLRLGDRAQLGLAVIAGGASVRVGLLAAAWMTDGGLLSVVVAHVAGAAVNGVGMLVAAAAVAPRAGATGLLRSLSIKVPPEALSFQIGTFGKYAVWTLAHNMDLVLLAQFVGAAELGLYKGARQIIDTTRYPFDPLQRGAQPEYSRHWYSRRAGELRRASLRFVLVTSALAAVGYGALVVFHRPIIRLALGGEFPDAAPLLLIMIPGTFVAASVCALTVLPAAVGRALPPLVGAIAGFATSAAVIVWLAPEHGAIGAAWANTAYFIVSALALLPFIVAILRESQSRRI